MRNLSNIWILHFAFPRIRQSNRKAPSTIRTDMIRSQVNFAKMIHRKKKEINLPADPKIWADLSEIPDQLSKRGETIIGFVFDTPH